MFTPVSVQSVSCCQSAYVHASVCCPPLSLSNTHTHNLSSQCKWVVRCEI